MHALLSNATAFLLLAHMALGCWWHHDHAQSADASASAAPCQEAGHDHPHEPCWPECGGEQCVFIRVEPNENGAAQDDAGDAAVNLPFAPADRLPAGDALKSLLPLCCPTAGPVRLHLAKQVLLL